MIPYFECILAFLAFSQLLETYLDIRQHKNLKIKEIPKKYQSYNLVTNEEFKKSQEYGLDKRYELVVGGAIGWACRLIVAHHLL